jgi:hypothetical protein
MGWPRIFHRSTSTPAVASAPPDAGAVGGGRLSAVAVRNASRANRLSEVADTSTDARFQRHKNEVIASLEKNAEVACHDRLGLQVGSYFCVAFRPDGVREADQEKLLAECAYCWKHSFEAVCRQLRAEVSPQGFHLVWKPGPVRLRVAEPRSVLQDFRVGIHIDREQLTHSGINKLLDILDSDSLLSPLEPNSHLRTILVSRMLQYEITKEMPGVNPGPLARAHHRALERGEKLQRGERFERPARVYSPSALTR